MLTAEDTVLVLIDFQEKLFNVMHNKEALLENAVKLVKGALVLDVPILVSEQNPNGLGPTIPEIKELLPDVSPVSKLSFSCMGEDNFQEAFEDIDRQEVILAGIEAHVCVYQTARDMREEGAEVHIVADAVSSRTPENKTIGLQRMDSFGATVTSVETVLFELMGIAEGDKFKQLLKVVK
jgi:nicotinamidase-related amidase